jgi:hypothetical protein
VFDRIWIDNLHGDRIISEYAPDGQTSETVFARGSTSPGIKIGTAIALLARSRSVGAPGCDLRYRDLDHARAADRRTALVESLETEHFERLFSRLEPVLELGLPFKPRVLVDAYLSWPLLPELFAKSFPGVKTSRDDVVVDIDRDQLEARMRRYFDPQASDDDLRREIPGAMQSTARFDAYKVRESLVKRGFLADRIVRYCYRPFDVRWLYWEPDTKLLDEKRHDYFPHVVSQNAWLSAGQRNRKEDFYQPQFTKVLADHHIVESNVGMFPLYLYSGDVEGRLLPNITKEAAAYLKAISTDESRLFFHTLGVLHGRAYRTENGGGLRQDWPRIPLPETRELLEASAAIGRQLGDLLDPECEVKGVTEGTVRPELRVIGTIASASGKPLSASKGDLAVTAGWGHAGKGGVTMPGKGKLIERAYTAEERDAIAKGAPALGLAPEQTLALLGETARDVFLNDTAYWRCVPKAVWEYTIGGYQVLKKWLSYRERDLLSRDLKDDEVREVMHIARRIAAILLLSPALDANYEAVKASAYPWPGGLPAATGQR